MTISPFVTPWQKRYGVNPDIENERRLSLVKTCNHFIFNRQHVVQKSLMAFLG
jgi:hypothetical protein